jgi:tetratricopeptide (TPR) repeat protein
MADRYSYVPLIGLFILLIWGVADWMLIWRTPAVVPLTASALVLCACAVLTWKQVGYWQNDVSLWQHAAYATRNNTKAHGNLGEALGKTKGPREALAEYRKGLDIDPNSPDIHFNVGAMVRKLGRVDEAVKEYRRAIELDPNFTVAHHNLGAIWTEQGRREEAINEFEKAIKLDPDQAPSHFALGTLFNDLGQIDKAGDEFQRALSLDPLSYRTYGALAQVIIQEGRYAEAEAILQRALDLMPSNHRLRSTLVAQLERMNRLRALEKKLPELVEGKIKAVDVREELDTAWLCRLPRHSRFAGAARFYKAAFQGDPKLIRERGMPFLYWAGCAAAQAGMGLGRDATNLTESERSKLRTQALDWLREDLDLWRPDAAGTRLEIRENAARALRLDQQDQSLAQVREPGWLTKLSEPEREAWARFWSEVDETLAAIHF